jgi:hypothetical protein
MARFRPFPRHVAVVVGAAYVHVRSSGVIVVVVCHLVSLQLFALAEHALRLSVLACHYLVLPLPFQIF